MHEDKRYLKVEITDWWGEPDEAGIDYFDIVRIDPTISETSKMDCSEKSGDCAPLPQFCPTVQCISDGESQITKFPYFYLLMPS